MAKRYSGNLQINVVYDDRGYYRASVSEDGKVLWQGRLHPSAASNFPGSKVVYDSPASYDEMALSALTDASMKTRGGSDASAELDHNGNYKIRRVPRFHEQYPAGGIKPKKFATRDPKRRPKSQTGYWTVVIPYAHKGRTEWHPTEASGPWSLLSRGAFATKPEAADWARKHLGQTKYRFRYIKPWESKGFQKFGVHRDPNEPGFFRKAGRAYGKAHKTVSSAKAKWTKAVADARVKYANAKTSAARARAKAEVAYANAKLRAVKAHSKASAAYGEAKSRVGRTRRKVSAARGAYSAQQDPGPRRKRRPVRRTR